ncbi:MAG: DUF5131 family protein [Candidatus Aegiribacteria sp.]|nr:DUF5131 family protein [Candidatus Aegiribacteria sp.]
MSASLFCSDLELFMTPYSSSLRVIEDIPTEESGSFLNWARTDWKHETWNPVTGCSPVSEEYEHCYARGDHGIYSVVFMNLSASKRGWISMGTSFTLSRAFCRLSSIFR